MQDKRCPRCGLVKPLEAFGRRPDGRPLAWCKVCNAEESRVWYANNREKRAEYNARPEVRQKRQEHERQARAADPDRQLRYLLNREYGMTVEEYRDLEAAQQGVCAICGNPCLIHSRLSVDHDHESGKVRGLLCAACNQGLGDFKDNPDLLLAAAAYLLSHRNVLEYL